MDNLDALSTWLEPLVQQLQPRERAALARRIATDLRRSQAARIAQQRNPDGTAFAPRSRSKASRAALERKRVQDMFAKLRTAKHLRTQASAEGAAVQILGRSARIARVHQFGLAEAVRPGGPEVDYPERQLLGFTTEDVDLVQTTVLAHLADKL